MRAAWLMRRTTVRDALRRLGEVELAGRVDEAALERAAPYVDRWIDRFPWPPSRGHCVPRSLVLFHLARRFGVEAQVCFGVRRDGAGLEGHAWLARGGEPMLEATDPRPTYATTYAFPEV